MVILNAPLLTTDAVQSAPGTTYGSKKTQAVLALFIGFGLGLAIMNGVSWQEPANATSMAVVPTGASQLQASARLQPTKAFGNAMVKPWMPGLQQNPPRAVFANAEMKTITILGATGLVGLELLDLIPRAWPDAKLNLFASRDKSYEYKGKTYQAKDAAGLEKDDAPKGDVAFVALDDAYSKRYVPRLLELGYRVIDKSNTYRMDPDVPLVVPGVNSDLVTDDVKLVANPNCNTIPFCLAVAPLQRKYGLAGATVSSYQAISGAGIGTLDDFISECGKGYSLGTENRIGTQFDAEKYSGNVFPHNGGTDDSGFSSEERKMMFESRKILRLPDFDISAQCCRVPVSVGHYENAWVRFKQPVSPEDVAKVLTDKAQAPFTHFKDGPVGDGVSTLNALENRDDTLVGRVRPDPRDDTKSTLCMTVAADNLRQGAATNAVRIASCWFPSKDPNLQAVCF